MSNYKLLPNKILWAYNKNNEQNVKVQLAISKSKFVEHKKFTYRNNVWELESSVLTSDTPVTIIYGINGVDTYYENIYTTVLPFYAEYLNSLSVIMIHQSSSSATSPYNTLNYLTYTYYNKNYISLYFRTPFNVNFKYVLKCTNPR